VDDAVWRLFEIALTSGAQAPVLIEWDSDLPNWHALAKEAHRANSARAACRRLRSGEVCHV
jgi:uncharacterized protein (UPF0276 family)